MYIRKHTKLDVSIFDVSTMDITTKKEVYDQVAQMYTDSLFSLKDAKMQTRLVVPAIFNQGNTRVGSSSGHVRHCLFDDILGQRIEPNRDCFGETRIINNLHKVYTFKKDKKIKPEQITADDSANAFVPEGMTLKLINKHHQKELKSSNKILQGEYRPGLGIMKSTTGISYVILNDSWSSSDSCTKTPEKSKFDPKTSILRTISHVLFVDTVYSVSEMVIAFEQLETLFRVSYNAVGYRSYFEIFNNGFNATQLINSLYTKYEVKGTNVWKRDTENRHNHLDDGNFMRLAYNSLLNEDETLIKSTHDVFIPVTFVLFLENASHLFQPSQSIIKEDHTIRNPRFFTSVVSMSGSVGQPDFVHKEDYKNIKGQTRVKPQSKKFTNISTDMYSLKTTLTIIPQDFSLRLIKSKLKSVNQFNVNKDCFYFFTDEDMERLTEKGKNQADYFFNVRFDDRIDLSYYTFAMNTFLTNRFASNYYSDYIELQDFIGFGKVIEGPKEQKLITIYDDLLGRQSSIAYKFNSKDQVLVTKEMFDYEKASLLLLYIIKQSNLNLYKIRREDWNSTSAVVIALPLHKNNYLFSQEIINRFYNNEVSFLRTGNERKAYLMEALFRLVNTLPKDQLLVKVEEIITDCKSNIDRVFKNYTSRQTLSKELSRIIVENNPQEVRDKFDRMFNKQRTALFKVNYRMYELLNHSESLQLIPMLLGNILMYSYLEQLAGLFRMYCSYIREYYSVSTFKVIDMKGLSTQFLTDVETHKRVQQEYRGYYSIKGETKLIDRLLDENARKTTGKIEVLEEFTDLLISEFNKEYFSTTK
jgi:hypothetical protein